MQIDIEKWEKHALEAVFKQAYLYNLGYTNKSKPDFALEQFMEKFGKKLDAAFPVKPDPYVEMFHQHFPNH